LASYTSDIISCILTIIQQESSLGIADIVGTLKVVELLILFFPNEGPQHFTRVLEHLLTVILANQQNKETVLYYLTLFSKILLVNQDYMVMFFSRVSQEKSLKLIIPFVEIWLSKVDLMKDSSLLKCTALGLCTLLTMNDADLLRYYESIVNVIIKSIKDGDAIPRTRHAFEETLLQKEPLNNLSVCEFAVQKLNDSCVIHSQYKNEIAKLAMQITQAPKSSEKVQFMLWPM